jgi:signal transduction histidine kinase
MPAIKLTIYRKMIIGLGLIILIMIGANVYTLFELHSVSKAARASLASDVQSIELAKQLRASLYEEERNAQKYLITRDRIYYGLFEQATAQFQEDLDLFAKAEPGEREIKLIHEIRRRHEWLSRSLIEASKPGRHPTSRRQPNDDPARREAIDRIDRSLERLIGLKQISIGDSMAALGSATRRSSHIAVAITLLALLAASTAAWIIARAITRPISRVIQATQQIAQGSFAAIRISSNDETALLADALNDMGDQLKKINEFKSDLMHQIVHELRTPLQVILSAQEILAVQQAGSVNSKQLEMLQLIRDNVGKLMKFTNQFLDLAKIEGGMMEYHLAPTDLLSVVARAVEEAQALAASHDISITLSATSAPQLLADGEKLAQVFSNLLSNAIKYTGREGTIDVTISSSQTSAQVAVRDSGIGIGPEDLAKLFTKFYRGANASRSGSGGTGLGLALVKALVVGHGGNVSVESAPGAGSTFTVDIPLARKGEDLVETIPAGGKENAIHGPP